jgi:hypothetical protein
VDCGGSTAIGWGIPPQGRGGDGSPGGSSTPPAPTLDIAGIITENGKRCYIVVPVSAAGMSLQEIEAEEIAMGALEAGLPECPDQPGRRAARLPTPQEEAEEFWDTIRLPVPRPVSSPDFATTGKTVFLQAGDTDAPPTWTRATPLGELRITARGTYTVDWGDGTPPSGPYADPGGPYPDGNITHTYDVTGTVRIVVREAWAATWHIGAIHGALAALHTTGTLPDFPVRQIQAVITG